MVILTGVLQAEVPTYVSGGGRKSVIDHIAISKEWLGRVTSYEVDDEIRSRIITDHNCVVA